MLAGAGSASLAKKPAAAGRELISLGDDLAEAAGEGVTRGARDAVEELVPEFDLGRAAPRGGVRRRSAPATEFERTETLSGRASSRRVRKIEESMRMRNRGFVGEPIKVVEVNGRRYVLDGDHRLEAARRVGVEVKLEVVDQSSLPSYNYKSVDEVLRASDNATPNRLRR